MTTVKDAVLAIKRWYKLKDYFKRPEEDGNAPNSPDKCLVHDNPHPLGQWAMNYNRNLAKSRLCGLPPELVHLIAHHLPPDGIYLLRQTSRHFRAVLPPVQRAEGAQAILRSQLYCSPCRELRGNSQALEHAREKLRRPFWCSGCQTKHPAVYFSTQQRSLSDDVRICIGREGHMRICDHFTLYWSWFEVCSLCPRSSFPFSPSSLAA